MSRIAVWRRGAEDPSPARGWLVGRGSNLGAAPKEPVDPKRVKVIVLFVITYLATAIALLIFVPKAGRLLPLLNLA